MFGIRSCLICNLKTSDLGFKSLRKKTVMFVIINFIKLFIVNFYRFYKIKHQSYIINIYGLLKCLTLNVEFLLDYLKMHV